MKTVPLKEVADIVMGSAPPGTSYNDAGYGIPMIAGAGDYGDKFPSPKKWTTAPTRVTEIGDLIVCVRATIGDLNWADKKYCLGRGVAGIRAQNGKLDINFAAHYINAHKRELSKLGTGSTFLAIRRADLGDFPIPLPPLPEQKRIAAILDKADAIRRKRQAAIKLADDFLGATFLDMFGDPVTNPNGWKETELNEVSIIASGVTKGRKFKNKSTAYVPYMRVANIQDGHIDLTEIKEIEVLETDREKYSLKPGDLLLTEGGDPDKLGRGAIWRGEVEQCIHQNHIFKVRINSNKILPEYLSSLIGSSRGKRYFSRAAKQTTGIASINITQLKAFPLLTPPIELQRKYILLLTQREKLLRKINFSTDNQELLFHSLTQRAFRGEL